MSRPETFTLRCDRCREAIPSRIDDDHEFYASDSQGHRQATLDGNTAGWRLTSLEEVCAACVAKEGAPLSERDPADFDMEAVRAALKNGPGGTSDD